MKTVFIRAIEAAVDDKAALVLAAVQGPHTSRFEAEVSGFASIPSSPFCYWATDGIRHIFETMSAFESLGRAARQGGVTGEDFRFLRLAWERPLRCATERWAPFAKGGSYSPFYCDIPLYVWWDFDRNTFWGFTGLKHRPSLQPASFPFYFRPGLTWPLRTNGLSIRLLPRGCVFGHKGPAAFVEDDHPDALLSLCALVNSEAFGALVAVQLARTELAQSFEVGLIQQTPVPDLVAGDRAHLADLARRSWSLTRQLDTRTENSHVFNLPALVQAKGTTLADRADTWGEHTHDVESELARLQGEIDDHAYQLYGISQEERQGIERGFGSPGAADEVGSEEDDGEVEELVDDGAAPVVAMLLSWSVGVAFGRFDVRLATGERPTPSELGPFDALPVCSPGMLTDASGLPVDAAPPDYPFAFPNDGILVDDKGHSRDLVGAIRSVFDVVFDDANAVWHEAAVLLGASDLRHWLAREFFEQHIKRYSKSRRKAPIYWQLSTPSGSYSVWLYIHRATSDTLFRVLNEFVGPKLDHETTKLAGMMREAGASPSAAQRRELDRQDTFVTELHGLKAEVVRVAPLWRPILDDGVILNFAPLWRLVPQSRGWQTECKRAWEKLASGDYDWAHLAMHLWPERVVPKCIDDRSLAIAHGVEEVFWYEDDGGAPQKRHVEETVFRKLVAKKASSTVKAALKDLLSAPTTTGGSGPKTKSARPAPRQTATHASAASSLQSAVRAVDDATLDKVRDAIAKIAGGASKADVLGATGLSESDWKSAIAVLLERGQVNASGQKRGTRYHVSARGEKA